MNYRKHRTATERPWNKWIERNHGGRFCQYFDGITKEGHPITECNVPWASKCFRNVFKCSKLKYQHLASIEQK